MAEPVPEPTPAQLEIVGEIMMIDDHTEILSIVSAYDQDAANAKWALTLTDITSWTTVKNVSRVKRVGEIEFFEGVSSESRLDFRNKVLRRYGQTELVSESPRGLFETTVKWF